MFARKRCLFVCLLERALVVYIDKQNKKNRQIVQDVKLGFEFENWKWTNTTFVEISRCSCRRSLKGVLVTYGCLWNSCLMKWFVERLYNIFDARKKKVEDFFQIFRASQNIWTLDRPRVLGKVVLDT